VLSEPGNVFHETQTPVLKINLTNRLDGEFKGRVYARSAGPGLPEEGNSLRSEWTVEEGLTLKKGESREIPIKVMPSDRKKRGWFDVEIGVESDGAPVQVYRTTYAVLAPDTRKAMGDSPFGVWEFWWPHASFARKDRQATDAATLINKGGWRWTYGGNAGGRSNEGLTAKDLFERYKITYTIRGLLNSYQRGEGWWNEKEFEEKAAPALRAASGKPAPGEDPVYKVLHESRSSTAIIRRFSEFFGGDLYAMPEAEKAKLDMQFSNVVQYCAAIKKADPLAKICLINDYPAVGIEFMKRGFPRESFDYFGTEGANFMREPERQPDWLCLLGIVQNWKRAQEKYGYQDKPLWTTESLYHATSPANLTLHAQSVIQVREALLSLANGVERMCAAGLLRDCTDDYRWSNWGMAGFCFREPEMNPKPNYAMYAWLTQILDQAKYAGRVAHDSTSLHILDFKTPAGSHVYPVWCVRGRQEVTLTVKGGRPVVLDAYGNAIPTTVQDERLTLAVSDTPLYITGTSVETVVALKPVEVKADGGSTIIDFDKAGTLAVVPSASRTLEGNWDYPRLKGEYAVDFVQEDGAGVVKLELKDDADPRKLLQRYVELKLAKPVVIKDRAKALTARVKGNGGWGRVMFEMVDAEGRIWTACGNQYAGSCNASDNRGDSYVSFDGWHTMIMDMPGNFPATDLQAYRASTTHWWPENTPEWRQQLASYEKANAAYEKAVAEFPALQRAAEEAMKAYDAKQAEYVKAKADYDKEQAVYAAAMKTFKASQSAYASAKASYDKAVKAGKKDGVAPVAPQTPTAPAMQVPMAPGEAPMALVAPKAPAPPRDYGIASLTYPVKLTKVILGAPPSLLYVTDEVPVKSRVIYMDQVGVLYENGDKSGAM
jgi:tetratricopeptide (TPR) repeat protein